MPSSHEGKYLRAVFELLDVGVLIADDDAKYLDVNRAACELLERDRESIVGRTVFDLVDESRWDDVRRQWRGFLTEGNQSGLFEAVLPDGNRRNLQFHARANFLPGLHCSFLAGVPAPPFAGDSEKDSTITICAWTKRVKVGEAWIPLEQYLSQELGIRVSHGISPAAFGRFSE